MAPASLLLSLADRLDALPPGSAHPRDALSMAHAGPVLRRLAPRVESEDPAVVAKAVGQIRSMRWSGPSAASALWGEAVDAVAGLGPPPAPEGAPGPSAADPRVVIQRALREAYERGRGDGAAAERATVAAWCDEQAKDAQSASRGAGSDRDYACEQDGERDAFEKVAAHLRGEATA